MGQWFKSLLHVLCANCSHIVEVWEKKKTKKMSSYKLRSVLRGHELDVRAVCPAIFPEGGILTASRDRTARLWVPGEENLGFEEGHVLSGHNNFISAVCTIPPTDKYPHGTSYMFLNKHILISLNSD